MSTRLVALVAQTAGSPKVEHFRGMPPEFTGGQDSRQRFPWPQVLVIKETLEGWFLLRFTKDGLCVGDTWHLNIDDAKHQAEYEYNNYLFEWQYVPPGINDPVAFALERA